MSTLFTDLKGVEYRCDSFKASKSSPLAVRKIQPQLGIDNL